VVVINLKNIFISSVVDACLTDTSSDFQLSPSRMREFSFRSDEVVIIYCRLVNKELSLKAKARAKDQGSQFCS